MRMLSGEELPDSGERVEGHNVVMQYFAQDEATRMDPAPTVYETLASGSPLQMVPAIRNILGGFLFSGDDIYKRVRVLSGGERTRLAVARMLLRPSNVLLLDEPTNHLDLDSKEVLLDALADYGGTLIFVSHDRYFVERLATKIIEIGRGTATVYPGTYKEFLWHKEHAHAAPVPRSTGDHKDANGGARALSDGRKDAKPGRGAQKPRPRVEARDGRPASPRTDAGHAPPSREDRKRSDADARKRSKAEQSKQVKIDTLETQIAETESAIRELEQKMSAPGFYDDRTGSQSVIDAHQALLWRVGDLMHLWEQLQTGDPPLPTGA